MSNTERRKSFDYGRYPKTHQERKSVVTCKEEGVHVRSKRCNKKLPSEYDDVPVAAYKEIVKRRKSK